MQLVSCTVQEGLSAPSEASVVAKAHLGELFAGAERLPDQYSHKAGTDETGTDQS